MLRLNTPAYFAADEEAGLAYYPEHEIEHYYVIQANGQIVGSGGFNFSGSHTTARISWDILHPEFQGKSLGSKLLYYRIQRLLQFGPLETIMVRTSQLAYRFYERHGFRLIGVVENYWAAGFDLYVMELDCIKIKKPL